MNKTAELLTLPRLLCRKQYLCSTRKGLPGEAQWTESGLPSSNRRYRKKETRLVAMGKFLSSEPCCCEGDNVDSDILEKKGTNSRVRIPVVPQ